MQSTTEYLTLVRKAILLVANERDINSVSNLQCLYNSFFSEDHYEQIAANISDGDLDNLKDLQWPELRESNEYLELYTFCDQVNKEHLAVVYKSDQLWQQPQAMMIFDLE